MKAMNARKRANAGKATKSAKASDARKSTNNTRLCHGAGIPEFGACFTVFFFCVLIPCINVIGYLSCYSLADATTTRSADDISKSNNLKTVSIYLANSEAKFTTDGGFKTFRLVPAEKPIELELAIEDLKGHEKTYPIDSKQKIKIDRSNNICRYRLTTRFIAQPVVDLSAVPLVGAIPIIAAATPIQKTVYREIEHPEFLLR